MNRNMLLSLFLVLLFGVVTSNCNTDQTARYKLQILKGEKKVLIECVFSGKDTNNDGVIDASELISFSETEDYKLIHNSKSIGWGAYVDINKMPMLTHTAADIRIFKFFEDEYKKGIIKIEYKTKTSCDFVYNSYYFWRTIEIEEKGAKIDIFHGIGDGTQGLSLMMLDSSVLSFKIKKM